MKAAEHPKKHKSSAWPTKKAMSQVYSLGLWGSNNDTFYSGEGSHNKKLVEPYILKVRQFLERYNGELTVCDLGCGDFNIGKQLVDLTKNYIAIDIVPELIRYNSEKFKFKNLEFKTLDIAKEELPLADVIILRQVLQHLSNDEIKQIVQKLNSYKFIILTEHLPNGEFIPNIDIISGQGIRLKKQSGVQLQKPPFNLNVMDSQELLCIDLGSKKGNIVTHLYTLK